MGPSRSSESKGQEDGSKSGPEKEHQTIADHLNRTGVRTTWSITKTHLARGNAIKNNNSFVFSETEAQKCRLWCEKVALGFLSFCTSLPTYHNWHGPRSVKDKWSLAAAGK
ncbi:hypothetical protein WN944_027950 [Citrus x changshan-huyou]|uniref:Uncharacterized protein n=1 Tax=Citrus x changshan-huyou TaxID=2935761 RepID=A0AAP0QAC4_9ROSI